MSRSGLVIASLLDRLFQLNMAIIAHISGACSPRLTSTNRSRRWHCVPQEEADPRNVRNSRCLHVVTWNVTWGGDAIAAVPAPRDTMVKRASPQFSYCAPPLRRCDALVATNRAKDDVLESLTPVKASFVEASRQD